MRNSPYRAIAKCLAEKLKPIQHQLAPRSYRDTFEFIDDIKDLNLNGMMMFLLDVSSLFTNVPVAETVDYICEFLSNYQQEIGIPTKTLKELLLRCTLHVQFLFDKQLYRQIDGVAMGSPLGPLLADVFIGKLERFQLSYQIEKLKHYGRYVDDIFAIATADTDALAVETLSDLLRQNYDEGDGQPTTQDLTELMGHCLKTFFTFEGIINEQTKGTPMGSPISGLIAEAVLQKLEKRLFGEYKPEFWARYVGDTFVIIDQDKTNYYEELLNSIIPDLQFTMEEEVGYKLSFLDVLVCRQPDGKLAMSVYRKPTTTLQRLSYNSNHPVQHKPSCVRTLY
ncbi:hypothetical protein SprV_0902738000 [Sparganum proliferum]